MGRSVAWTAISLSWAVAFSAATVLGAVNFSSPLDLITTPSDPFRYLRPSCAIDDPTCSHAVIPLDRAACEPPADSIAPELVSFEEWKARQMQAAPAHEEALVDGPSEVDLAAEPDLAGQLPDSSSGPANALVNETVGNKAAASAKSLPAAASARISSSAHRYNYASPDCSARIHSSSSLTQHASSLLHKSRDRYMLTPCSAKEHWVVIELCDDIRIEAVEVGLFEFYSGVFKDVLLSVGGEDDSEDPDDSDMDDPGPESSSHHDRHRSRWQAIGNFTGRNVRGTQTFTLDRPTAFHRLLRIEFPTHYGTEYYCPISSVKVWGMNQMEAFRWEQRRNRATKQDEGKRNERAATRRESARDSSVVARVETSATTATDAMTNITTRVIMAASDTAESLSRQNATSDRSTTLGSTTTSRSGSNSFPVSETATAAPFVITSEPYKASTTVSSVSAAGETVATNETAPPGPKTPALSSDAVSAAGSLYKSGALTSSTDVQLGQSTDTLISTIIVTQTISHSNPHSSNTIAQRHPPHVPNAKADSSESIYAFIVRRLNALEANSTLTEMYVEEQFKATRSLLKRLEEGQEARYLLLQDSLREDREQEKQVADKRLSSSLQRMERVLEAADKDRKLTAKQIRALADEITYEKRRGIVQLLLTLSLVVMGATLLSRNLEATILPLPPAPRPRSWGSLAKRTTSPDAAGEAKAESRDTAATGLDTNDLAHGILRQRSPPLLKLRRPGTPLGSKRRSNLGPTSPRSPGAPQHDQARFQGSHRPPRISLPGGHGGIGPSRRLARSAHLHSIEPDRHRHIGRSIVTVLDSTTGRATLAASGTGSAPRNELHSSSSAAAPAHVRRLVHATDDGLSSDYEDDTGASASEAEAGTVPLAAPLPEAPGGHVQLDKRFSSDLKLDTKT